MKLCILVSAFCLLTALGLGSNVGVDTILAPSGTIDSGVAVTPIAVVANYGSNAESLWAFMAVDAGAIVYLDSVWLPAITPAGRETVSFSEWTPTGRDSETAVSWTKCGGDTFPRDDTARVRFLVRVIDASITIIQQPDTVVDSGVPILPRVRVWNHGNQSLNCYVRFRVDTTYYSRSHDLWLIAGGATVVSAQDSWYPLPGRRVLACSLFVLPADTCIASTQDTFYVRGSIFYDVGVTRIWSSLPPDSIHVGDTVIVGMTAANLGDAEASFWGFFFFQDSGGGSIYAESSQVLLSPGDSTQCEFPYVFVFPGTYVVACSVSMVGDQNPTNDVKRLLLHVLPVSVEESPAPRASNPKPQATVLRHLPAGAVVFDAMGRRVAAPKSGVFFLAVGGERPAVATVLAHHPGVRARHHR